MVQSPNIWDWDGQEKGGEIAQKLLLGMCPTLISFETRYGLPRVIGYSPKGL